jgi:hypothetical protein
MTDSNAGLQVVPVADLREYFRDALQGAMGHQHLKVDDHTEHYVVNLLTLFSRAETLHEDSGSRAAHRPLAALLADAAEASSVEARCRALQRLGDVSLFFAGFFAGSFARKLVDIDYHIAMGGRAYGTLAGAVGRGPRRVLGQVFGELAEKFQPLVDALNEIAETSYKHSDRDILRLYEIWLKTDSRRARGLLEGLGVTPTRAGGSLRSH